jgi:hypothetical protein
MTLVKKISLIWISILVGFLVSLILPHSEVTAAGFLSYSLQALLFVISLYLVRHETVKKNKFIFANFATFFSISFLFHVYQFVGTVIFPRAEMASHYYFQYVSLGLYFFLLAFAICYLTVDLLFRDFKTAHKYLLTLVIVGGFFAYYYHPYFANPRYLYTTPAISEWKQLDHACAEYRTLHGAMPTEHQLAEFLQANDTVPWVRSMDTETLEERVRELYPYLAGSNYMILLLKPIYLNTIYMCVLCVGLILLFFGYQYKKDPPQGAYIEKMMFFFLLFCTLEVFHAWSFIKTIEWQEFSQFVIIGQYLSAGVLACVAVLFGLRLRFITSAYGEFYEHEIAERPNTITRWRDAVDNLVLAHFFNRNQFVGRFLVMPRLRSKHQ